MPTSLSYLESLYLYQWIILLAQLILMLCLLNHDYIEYQKKSQIVKDTIDDYLARGWIRPSSSSYGAPVIVIHKNTGELRIVIDYPPLNKQTRLEVYPIPHIDELLDHLDHAKYFSIIDLASGYLQINMVDGHEEKTAFLIKYGTFQLLVLPLGLTNAPAIFQRLMNGIFYDFLNKTLLVFLDDLLVQSDSDIQYFEDIRYVLQCLRYKKLIAKKRKM